MNTQPEDSRDDAHQLEYARRLPKRHRRRRCFGDWLTGILAILVVSAVIPRVGYQIILAIAVSGPGVVDRKIRPLGIILSR